MQAVRGAAQLRLRVDQRWSDGSDPALPIALGCFAAAVAWLVFEGTSGFQLGERQVYNFYIAHQGLIDALLGALKILYFVGLPLFCWYVAWLRVKEAEVSHGV